jgi:6-pyruvoyltetrahydropterin/6-carboxytetrahydropterin synthase
MVNGINMKAQISKTFKFDSGHHLPNVPAGHPCAAPHGHSYRATVTVEGEVDPGTGWVMDFNRIRELMAPLLAQFDHHDLNTVPGLANPTSEMIAKWLWDRLKPQLPGLSAVTVAETETSQCVYRGQ